MNNPKINSHHKGTYTIHTEILKYHVDFFFEWELVSMLILNFSEYRNALIKMIKTLLESLWMNNVIIGKFSKNRTHVFFILKSFLKHNFVKENPS